MSGNDESSIPVTDSYVWQIPGKAISVHLRFDVVDRMMLEVMRGFGAVPRRGAEVGGVLLGTVETGEVTTVRIDDFEVVACEYRHGPSFQLSEADQARFDDVLTRRRPEINQTLYPVGFYRSQTRDGLSVSEDDLALLNSRFPAASDVILLVKPYATRVSVGGFFFREDGGMRTESSYLEFPFRRRDLGGGESVRPSRRNLEEIPAPAEEPATPSPLFGFAAADPEQTADIHPEPLPTEAKKPSRRGNVWIPLSFIFLLLGVLLGFQAALTTRPQIQNGFSNPYALGLRLTRVNDTVHIRWDRTSPAIRSARRGVLSISDGAINKNVDLDAATLQNASVIYRHGSNNLSFRLETFPSESSSVSETVQATVDRIPAEMPARPER